MYHEKVSAVLPDSLTAVAAARAIEGKRDGPSLQVHRYKDIGSNDKQFSIEKQQHRLALTPTN